MTNRRSGRRRAVKDQRGKWCSIPKPRAVSEESRLRDQAPVSLSQDPHLRWRLILHVAVSHLNKKRAAMSIAHRHFIQVALAKKVTADLDRAHQKTVSEKDAEIKLLRTDIEDFLFWNEQAAEKLAAERESVSSLTAQLSQAKAELASQKGGSTAMAKAKDHRGRSSAESKKQKQAHKKPQSGKPLLD